MKRLQTREATFYCWNMTTKELYIPLIVDSKFYNVKKPNSFHEKLFISIDENRLYFRDFWDKHGIDRRDYIKDESEQARAEGMMLHATKDKKYRNRFFRDHGDLRLIGKKSLKLNGNCYIQLTFIKFTTGTIKFSLFSKRTNDFIFSKYFYEESKTVQEHIDYARHKIQDCEIKCETAFGIESVMMIFHKTDQNYTPDQLNKITNFQRKFKSRKLLVDFEYYSGQSKFNIQVYWLKCRRVLLFKIYLDINPDGRQELERLPGFRRFSRMSNLHDITQFMTNGMETFIGK